MNTTNSPKLSEKVKRCARRGGIAAAVLLVMWPLGIEEKFLCSGVFAVLWLLEPAWARDRGQRAEGRGQAGTSKVVAVVLAVVLIYLPFEASGLPVREQADPEVIAAMERRQQELAEGRFTVCEFIAVAAIGGVIAGGYVWYYYKSKKACKKVGSKRERQIESTNPWPNDPEPPSGTNGTNRVRFPRIEFGAYFYEGLSTATPTPEHLADCQCHPLPVIEWVTPEANTAPQFRIYFPTNLVTFEDFLAENGLVEATTNNYSLNRAPAPEPPPFFTHTNRTLTISANGDFTAKVTTVLQRSVDLLRWETVFTSTATPLKTTNNYMDGERPPVGVAFYRVVQPPQ